MPPREQISQPPVVPEFPELKPAPKTEKVGADKEKTLERGDKFRDFLADEARLREERGAKEKAQNSKAAENIARGEELRGELKLAQQIIQPLNPGSIENLDEAVANLTAELDRVTAEHAKRRNKNEQPSPEELLYEDALRARLAECDKLLFERKKSQLNKAQQRLEEVRAEERRILEDLKACEQDVLDGALGLYNQQKNQDILDPIIVTVRQRLEISKAGLDKLSGPPPEAEPKNKALRVLKRIGKFLLKLFSSEKENKKESQQGGVSLSQMSETTIMIPSEAPEPVDRATKVQDESAQSTLAKEDKAAAAAGGKAYYDALAQVNSAYESAVVTKRKEAHKQLNQLLAGDTISGIAKAAELIKTMEKDSTDSFNYFEGYKVSSGKPATKEQLEKYIADRQAMFKTAEYNSNLEATLKGFSGDEAALKERLSTLIQEAQKDAAQGGKPLQKSLLANYLRHELKLGVPEATKEAMRGLLAHELGGVSAKSVASDQK